MKQFVFVSSVQRELAYERAAVRDFIRGDPLLGQYFDVFLFEDLPAGDAAPATRYLAEVERAAVCLGIFGNDYGWEDAEGVSPTEREFDHATVRRKLRLVFVKGADDNARHEKMRKLIRKAERQLTRRRFVDVADLNAKVYASLVRHLEESGALSHLPFHAAPCPDARLDDIDRARMRAFLQRARTERNLALKADMPVREALTALNLLHDGQPPARRSCSSARRRSASCRRRK